MKNITLIGMPGAGKSTIGVVLAKMMGYECVDSDLVIQRKTGKLLHEIISNLGNDGFLKIENDINAELNLDHSVIATGGSTVYCTDAMKHFKEISTIIYIKLSYEEIEKRLGDLHERGVVLKDGYTLRQLYDERIALYEKYADIIFESDNHTIQENAICIANAVNELNK